MSVMEQDGFMLRVKKPYQWSIYESLIHGESKANQRESLESSFWNLLSGDLTMQPFLALLVELAANQFLRWNPKEVFQSFCSAYPTHLLKMSFFGFLRIPQTLTRK